MLSTATFCKSTSTKTPRTPSMSLKAPPRQPPRESWMAYDKLISNAFAPQDTPSATPTPTLHPLELNDEHKVLEPELLSPDGKLLDPVWDAVRQMKVKNLASLPSKVKSLEGIEKDILSPTPLPPLELPLQEQKKLKRKSSATFKESPDGRFVTAIFDMGGVNKQDMHVSYKANHIIVTWRRVKVIETKEDGALVRERKEKQYSQMIPLPERTRFDEIKAARNGRYLMLTFPNLKCVRVTESVAASSTAWSSGETSFYSCHGSMLDLEEFEVDKAEPSTPDSKRHLSRQP